MMRALAVGDILVDTIAEVDQTAVDLRCRLNSDDCEICFDYGHKIPILSQQQFAGGNAANVAMGLAKLGVSTSLVAVVGDDRPGEFLRQQLKTGGVLIDRVHIDSAAPTSSAFIVTYKGEKTVFSYHAHHQIEVTVAPDVTHLYLTSTNSDLETLLRQINSVVPTATLIFQPGTSQLSLGVAVLAPVLAQTSLLILNKDEALTLLKRRDHFSPKALLHALLDTKAKEIVVTDGKHGAYLSDGRTFIRVGIWQSAVCVDTTGVGDAFASGFIWSHFHQRSDLPTAGMMGAYNAGSVISKLGAQNGLCTTDEINELHQKIDIDVETL